MIIIIQIMITIIVNNKLLSRKMFPKTQPIKGKSKSKANTEKCNEMKQQQIRT